MNNNNMKRLLIDAYKNGYTIPAFNFDSFEMLDAILKGAFMANSPIIVQTTQVAIERLGLERIVFMVKNMAKEYDVNIALHLDHADNIDIIKKCLSAGYDSIMIDYSKKNTYENIAMSNYVKDIVKEYDAAMEVEIGIVEKIDTNSEKTDVNELKKFLNYVSPNSVGVSIGNEHGYINRGKEIDFALLKSIYMTTDIPLVLHGGSSIVKDNLKDVANYGICKVNFETSLRVIFRKSLDEHLKNNPDEIKIRNILDKPKESVSNEVSKICEVLHSKDKLLNSKGYE